MSFIFLLSFLSFLSPYPQISSGQLIVYFWISHGWGSFFSFSSFLSFFSFLSPDWARFFFFPSVWSPFVCFFLAGKNGVCCFLLSICFLFFLSSFSYFVGFVFRCCFVWGRVRPFFGTCVGPFLLMRSFLFCLFSSPFPFGPFFSGSGPFGSLFRASFSIRFWVVFRLFVLGKVIGGAIISRGGCSWFACSLNRASHLLRFLVVIRRFITFGEILGMPFLMSLARQRRLL